MNSPRTIQVVTDISDASYNEMFGIMHGVARAMSSSVVPFAPVAAVDELSIVHGAFLTRLMAKSYIAPTVIFTNVAPHPVHKTDIIAKLTGKDIIFIGSNNGICDWIARDFGFDYITQVMIRKPFVVDGKLIYLPGEDPPDNYDEKYGTKTDFLTFSAHIIYGSIAVALALGVEHTKFGEPRTKDVIVPLNIVQGEIVHIDNYGNAKIFGHFPFSVGTAVRLSVKGKPIAQASFITDRMMSHPTDSFVVYPSTSLTNMVDLALVRGNACRKLNLTIGDVIEFKALS